MAKEKESSIHDLSPNKNQLAFSPSLVSHPDVVMGRLYQNINYAI